MPKTARDVPPPLELLCLKASGRWRKATSSDVQQLVAASRPLAYTTIMTVLDRLVRKGKLTRRKAGRAFVLPARTRAKRCAVWPCANWWILSSTARRPSCSISGLSRPRFFRRGAGPKKARIDTVLL